MTSAEIEGVTDLVRRPAVDVAQTDHGRLRRGQGVDRLGDLRARLGREQPLLGQVARADRTSGRDCARRPRAGSDRGRRRLGHTGRIVERGERQDPSFALGTGLCRVDEDPKDPRLEGRTSLEAVEGAEHAHPGLADHFLGDRAVRGRRCARREAARRSTRARSAAKAASSPARSAATSSRSDGSVGALRYPRLKPRAGLWIEQVRLARPRPERDPRAPLRRQLRLDPCDELRLLTAELGRREDVGVRSDLLDDLDGRRRSRPTRPRATRAAARRRRRHRAGRGRPGAAPRRRRRARPNRSCQVGTSRGSSPVSR